MEYRRRMRPASNSLSRRVLSDAALSAVARWVTACDVSAGIIDPVNVTRSAVERAAKDTLRRAVAAGTG